MQCKKVRQVLEACEGHAIPGPDRARIEAHLEGCKECHHAMARVRRLREILVAAPAPPVPEGFSVRVVACVKASHREISTGRSAPARRLPWERLRMAGGTAAALAAGLAMGAFFGNDVGRNDARRSQPSHTRQADGLRDAGIGRLVGDSDDSLAQAYLDLTTGRDG